VGRKKYVSLFVCFLFLLMPLGDATSLSKIESEGMPNYFISIDAGPEHTCATSVRNSTMCWGVNNDGELGVGEAIPLSPTPLRLESLKYMGATPSAGGSHSCTTTLENDAYCWGKNEDGELGTGDNDQSYYPVLVTGGLLWDHIATGYVNTCGVTTAGAAYCWGSDSYGQIGSGVPLDPYPTIPTAVLGFTEGTVQSISVGEYFACALTTGEGVKCWGYNEYGQLGNGDYDPKYAPVDVVGLGSGIIAIATGNAHACALTSGGGVKCWGRNWEGQLGDDRAENYSNIPVDVTGLSTGVMSVAAGSNHTCAVTTEGAVKCWGRNNQGQVGDNSTVDRIAPVDVSGLSEGVIALTAGHAHTCALMDAQNSGGIKCWGDNLYGQLGMGETYTDSLVPIDVISTVGKISGEVQVSGAPAGPIGVAVFLDPEDSEPFANDYPYSSGDTYEVWYLEEDDYYILAYLDVDGSGEDIDWTEPYVWYDADENNIPDTISLPEGEGVEGINLIIQGEWIKLYLPLIVK